MKWKFFSGPLSFPIQWVRSKIVRKIHERSFSLKDKITFLLILNVAGILLLCSYLDFHLTKKAQIDLYLDKNLYIAKEIAMAVPDAKVMEKLPQIQNEVEDWLLSQPSLVGIDVFLLSRKGWKVIVSNSKEIPQSILTLSNEQIELLKKDKYLSSNQEIEDESYMEVIVPLHSGEKVTGGVRTINSLNEAQIYLSQKKHQALLLTFFSIFIIFITVSLLFGKLVGTPIKKLIEAMTKAEKGNLEAQASIQSRDELGELGRHFNRMLGTIRETHKQNVQLLSQVNQFNEELTRKIEDATSELAKRNEELRLLNEALFRSQRELSQSEKLAALGEVAATMAHQIGTPLNSISGYIQLMLQEGNLQPKDRDRLKIVESQLDRLADSVKDLLSITRLPRPQLTPLNVNGVLEELIHLIEPWLHTRKVRLLSSLHNDLPLVMGDPTNLQTVFLNLIANALDAMPHGGLVTIRTQNTPPLASTKNNGWVEISISDTGIGLTEESKKKIFDPFFTTKKIGEGSGLGLAICQKIVKEHSGSLEVESEVGKGSTFSIFVPILQRNETDEQNISPYLGR